MPMVLPLFLSPSNTSRRSDSLQFRRCHLQKEGISATDARVHLYDNLLTNGYYTMRLYIRTPPQEFTLIADSGSTVTYVPCATCDQCGNHQDPIFQPDLSSTYQPFRYDTDCTCDNERVQCVYERQYAEISSSSRVIGDDILSYDNESALKPQCVVFVYENSGTGDLFSQDADGIMGLGQDQLSIMDQLIDKGLIGDSFSLCYDGMDIGGGTMVLGEISFPPGMVFSASDPSHSFGMTTVHTTISS